jgi:DNA-binding beta-propeller fold protein YncE
MQIKQLATVLGLGLSIGLGTSTAANAEILAMMNYESMPADSLKTLKLGGTLERREGIAIIDVDPASDRFGEILWDMPMNPEWVAHHIFYNPAQDKAYITFLMARKLGIMDMTQNPYRVEIIDVEDCAVGEDIIFPTDDDKWYLTCMGSDAIVVGDANTDKILDVIKTTKPWPHGFDIDNRIDRALATSTANPSDMNAVGDYLTVIEASSNKVIGEIRVSEEGAEGPAAPVEVLFVPDSNPPLAYVTNMHSNSLWTVQWNTETESFDAAHAFNMADAGGALPLEMYLVNDNRTMYVTTAQSGMLHEFDISKDPLKPEFIKTLKTGGGAHHVALDKEGRYLFVQNSFVNLPGMHEGTVTVIDRNKMEVIKDMTTLKDNGLTPNSIVLLPKWNDLAGH